MEELLSPWLVHNAGSPFTFVTTLEDECKNGIFESGVLTSIMSQMHILCMIDTETALHLLMHNCGWSKLSSVQICWCFEFVEALLRNGDNFESSGFGNHPTSYTENGNGL